MIRGIEIEAFHRFYPLISTKIPFLLSPCKEVKTIDKDIETPYGTHMKRENEPNNPFNDPNIDQYIQWYWSIIPIGILQKYDGDASNHDLQNYLNKLVKLRDKWVQDTMDDRIGMI